MKSEEGLNTLKVGKWIMKKKLYFVLIISYLLMLYIFVVYAKFNLVSVIFGAVVAALLIFFERQIRKRFDGRRKNFPREDDNCKCLYRQKKNI